MSGFCRSGHIYAKWVSYEVQITPLVIYGLRLRVGHTHKQIQAHTYLHESGHAPGLKNNSNQIYNIIPHVNAAAFHRGSNAA